MEEKIKKLITNAQTIVIVQADNPDADSLGSALALEHILSDQGKEVSLYCGVDIPTYLRYMSGWDRVQKDLPKLFDLSIIVDASTYTLLEQLEKTQQLSWLKAKPCVVLDHHTTIEHAIDFAAVSLIDPDLSSTGELIYAIARHNAWSVNTEAAAHIMSAMLGDTQGLMNDKTTAGTYRTMADLTDLGANRPLLEELRREYGRMPEGIYRYKGELIARTEFVADGGLATVTIPQNEINEYSPLFNPAVLVQFDSLQVSGVKLSVIFKTYDGGRITGKIRCNLSAPIGDKLAEHFGGGGHPHSAGFKVTDGRTFAQIKKECISYAVQLLDELAQRGRNETV